MIKNLKTFLCSLCALTVFTFSTGSVTVMAEDESELPHFTVNVSDDKLEVIFHDITVVVENDTMFFDGTIIYDENIPSNDADRAELEKIENWAANHNHTINKLTFSDNVTDINATFDRFIQEFETITFGNNIDSIGDSVFCEFMGSEIVLPEKLRKIGSNAFESCDNIEAVIIPESVETIGNAAFANCDSLENITFMSLDVQIAKDAFAPDINGIPNNERKIYGYTGSTAEVYANENGFKFVALEENEILGTGQCGENVYWTLYSDGTLDLSGTGATYDYTFNHSAVTDPDGLKHYEVSSEFGYPTWYDLDFNLEDFSIKTINIGEGITRLGDLIFSDNYLYCVDSINLPDSLEEIGYFALSICSENHNAINKFPENLKIIESGGFYAFDFRDKIVLPESVEKIGSLAFNTTAKEYVIPQNIKEISPLAFGFTENENYVDNNPIYDEVNDEYLEPLFKFVEVAIYRKDCDSVLDMFKADTDVTVYGYTDTTVEVYSNENNFEFVPLNEEPVTTTSAISTSTETTTTIVIEDTTSETISQSTTITSGNTATTTTSKNMSVKENSPKTGDKGIIGISAVLFSALGALCISKKRQ